MLKKILVEIRKLNDDQKNVKPKNIVPFHFLNFRTNSETVGWGGGG